MKEDAPTPDRPPRKRRQLETVPDVWLAEWLVRGDLLPSERKKVEQERERRKVRVVPTVVGVTATRSGLSPQQRTALYGWLIELDPSELHHGDCVGGDAQIHDLAIELGIPVVLHPPADGKHRAHCRGAQREERALDYLARDREIVKPSSVVLGAPKELREPNGKRAGGTWYTIRYARQRGTKTRVVLPDGREEES